MTAFKLRAPLRLPTLTAAMSGAGTLTMGVAKAFNPLGAVAMAATMAASGNITASGGGGVSTLTSRSFTSAATTGTHVETFGVYLRDGDAPSTIATDLPSGEYQVTVKARYPSGSVRHAIISVVTPFTQNVAKTINITNGTPPSGTALTQADIPNAAVSGAYTLTVAGVGTVTFNPKTDTPFDSNISGPRCTQWRFNAQVGSSRMLAWLQFRLYSDGRCSARMFVENGYWDNGAGDTDTVVNRNYALTMVVNGSTVYSSGSDVNHRFAYSLTAPGQAGAPWHWVNGTNPQITPGLSVYLPYLEKTKAVPQYGKGNRSPSSTKLDSLVQTYAVSNPGPWNAWMGDQGFNEYIGILPNHEALLITSGGDARAYRATLAGAASYNNFPITRRDSTTKRIPKPSAFATWAEHDTNPGPGATGGNEYPVVGGVPSDTNVQNYWEQAHHPSAGFLAYLLTGDDYYYEVLLKAAFMCWAMQSSSNGSGTSRVAYQQVRTAAWSLRTWGQLAAIAPDDDDVAAEYRTLLLNNYATHAAKMTTGGDKMTPFGVPFWGVGQYGQWPCPAGASIGTIAGWMVDYFVACTGYVSDLNVSSAVTNLTTVRDLCYRWPVGRLGLPGESSTYSYLHAGTYGIKVASSDTNTAAGSNWYTTWQQIFENSVGTNTSMINTLQGTSGAALDTFNTPRGYWANLLGAIAYAMDHGAPGAVDAFARLRNASNFESTSSGFNDLPVLNIRPRDPAYLENLGLDTWLTVPNSSISLAQTYSTPTPPGQGFGDDGKPGIFAWCGGAWGGGKMRHVACSGHTNGSDNAAFEMNMLAASPAWVCTVPPSANANIVQNTLHYTDGRPTGRHNYNEAYYVELRNRHFMIGCGSGYGDNPSNWHEVDALNLANNTYDNSTMPGAATVSYPHGNTIGYSHQTGLPKCQDPAGNVYTIIPNNALLKWNAATLAWSQVGGSNFQHVASGNGDSSPAMWDINRDRFLVFGNGTRRMYTHSAGSFTESTPTFTGAAAANAINGCAGVFVPIKDKYFFWTESSSDQNVYAIEAAGSSLAVNTYPIAGSPPPKTSQDGRSRSYGRFNYDRALCLLLHYGATTTDNLRVCRLGYL